MSQKDCPFCEINPEITEVLEDGPLCYVALSNPRLIKGHTLVIPKRHVEKPWELTADEIASIYATILKFQKKTVEKLATGCDIRQNYRPFIPQGRVKVDHIHFHLLPRDSEDGYFKKVQVEERDLWTDLSQKERQSLKKQLS